MNGREGPAPDGRWTRTQMLQAAVGGGAVLVGGAALGIGGGSGTSLAAPSPERDAEILNLFLLLEYVQEAFYREALSTRRLKGDLLEFAENVGAQESEHVGFLTERLGSRAQARPRSDFSDSLTTPERFRDAAIELEEATIAVYVGQAASLTRDAVDDIATLVSVEARQAAWLRNLAGVSPAPRAADPARKPDDVLADLRKRGFLA